LISDGDFAVNGEGNQPQQLQQDNVNLMVNSIDYLSDDTGLIELRTKDSLNAMLFFGVVVLVIFNFALESMRESIRMAVPGVLWVSFAFAGTLGLNRMFASEKEFEQEITQSSKLLFGKSTVYVDARRRSSQRPSARPYPTASSSTSRERRSSW
jgi:hypothetical protein